MNPQPPTPETEATRAADEYRRGEHGHANLAPSSLHALSVNADDYRHALIHAGWLIPKNMPYYIVCPWCSAQLQEEGS